MGWSNNTCAEPHSRRDADLRTGGHWFDPRLGQYSLRGLMIVIATGFIPLSPLSLVSKWLCGKAASGLERILCRVEVKRTQESMDRCNGNYDITEILLKTALNTIQSTNNAGEVNFKNRIRIE